MEKEFVPYELAVKLKTLGFDEPCFVYYKRSNENKPAYPNHGVIQNSVCGNGITAPTFSQAFRWFREEHDLDNAVLKDRYVIETQEDLPVWYYGFNTYEEAELDCLTKLIDLKSE